VSAGSAPLTADVAAKSGSISSTTIPRASLSVGMRTRIGAGSFFANAAIAPVKVNVKPILVALLSVTRSIVGSPIASADSGKLAAFSGSR